MDKLEHLLSKLSRTEKAEQLNDEEKERIMNNVNHKMKHKKVHKIYPRYMKVAGIILAVCVAIGSVVTATSVLNGSLASYFGTAGVGTDAVKATLNNAETTTQGVNVKVAQVIGDKYGMYIGIKVQNVKDVLEEVTFKHATAQLDPSTPLQCSSSIYMGVDEGVQSFIYHINTKEQVTGRKISFTLEDYGYWNEKKEFVAIVKGKWTLTWQLDYEDSSKTIEVKKDVKIGNESYQLLDVVVSPLSATAHFEGRPSTNIPFVVAFMDGTLTDINHVGKYDLYDADNMMTLSFHKIVQLSNIENITIGDVTIPITENKHPIERECYSNPNMDVSISMPKTLFDIVTAKDIVSYKDKDFKAKTERLDFKGTIDGVSAPLFSIYRIHKEMTEDELDECNPMMNFVAQRNGCTYTVFFNELETEETIEKFAEVMNQDVSPLVPWIHIAER